MRVQLRFLLAAILLAQIPSPVLAQMCRGGVDFSTSKVQGQAGLEIDGNSSLYAISGGLGGRAYFGLAMLGVRTYDYRPGNTYMLGFGAGRVFQHQLTGRVRHCIEVRGDFGQGPDAPGETRADESNSSITFELTSGLPLSAGSLAVTPLVGIAARYSSVVTTLEQGSSAVNDFYELVTVGVGVSASSFSVQPYAQFPMGRDISDTIFGLRVSIGIGAAPSR